MSRRPGTRDDGAPNPASGPPRHVVAAAVLLRGRRVLLCRRRPDRAWYPGVWDLPGGHLDSGETPDDAVARECREELGIDVVAPTRLPVASAHPLVDMTVFVVRSWRGDLRNAAPAEHDRIGWFDAHDLHDLPLADPAYRPLLTGALTGGAPDDDGSRAGGTDEERA